MFSASSDMFELLISIENFELLISLINKPYESPTATQPQQPQLALVDFVELIHQPNAPLGHVDPGLEQPGLWAHLRKLINQLEIN